jgi:hypothetical protein
MPHTVNHIYRSGGAPPTSADTDAATVQVDSSSGFLEWNDNGTVHEAVDAGSAQTVSGLKTFSGSAKFSSATVPTGYATGAGGAVTQITSASTGVTLSKPCGQITTVALTTAAAAEEAFTVTNTLVAATDVVVLSTTYAGAGTPIVYCKKVAAGSFDIGITNVHAANAMDAVIVINFAVFKAVAA